MTASDLTPSPAYPAARPRLTFIGFSIALGIALVVASWLFILMDDRTQAHGLLSAETYARAWDFLKELAGIGTDATPAFLRADLWLESAALAYRTLIMSVLGIAFAGVVALVTFMFGARNVMLGELAPARSVGWRLLFFATRLFFIATRGVPELMWALIVVFVFSPGLLPGAVALGVHNAGILGKLASEVVEGLDLRPARALRSTGAGNMHILLYAILPQALPRFLTYLLYRWEVVIRTTIVVGFVAAGGLGLEFRLAMSYFQYTKIALLLVWYLILVLGVDFASAGLRRLAR